GLVAEMCAAAGDQRLAAEVYERLLPEKGRLMTWGIVGFFTEGPYDRQLGLLAASLGQRETAAGHFEAAAAANRRLGLRPHLARVLYEHARMLAEQSGAPDAIAASGTLADEARTIATELEMTGLLGLIDALQSPKPAGPSDRAPPGFALRREGDFWTVL